MSKKNDVRDLEGILLKESIIGQFDNGIGAFANRDFKREEVVDFFQNSIYLLKLRFLPSLSVNFLAIYTHMPLKFSDKSAQKPSIFSSKTSFERSLVIKWDLRILSNEEYENLPEYEKNNFCHQRDGLRWLCPDPERHVNRFHSPNVIPDFEKQENIALRDIKKGEELSIADNIVEDF